MFEKWIEGMIVEYFSEWLEGFDKEGMRIALFGGKIMFQNLKFRKQALDKLHLPVVLKEGRLGVLNVKVPWKRLSKESVHIVLEDLYILLGPTHDDTSETRTALDDRSRQSKQRDIRLRELLFESSDDDPPDKKKQPTNPTKTNGSSTSWKQKMMNLILDNLTFELKRIHIRYEDSSLLVSKTPISFGISIDELKISTTNANGHVTFMDRSTSHTPFVHKVFGIVEGYIYWDLALSNDSSQMTYLVEPVTTVVKITENHDIASHEFIPKFRVHIDLPSLHLAISPKQCKDIANVLDFFMGHELYLKRSHCRKSRPNCTVHENPHRWWKYALQSIQHLEHSHERCTWRKTLALLVLRGQYIPLYMKSIEGKATPVDVQQLNILEDDPRLSAECIVFYRSCAKEELDHETKRKKQLSKSTSSKWTSMLKKSSSKPNTPVSSPRSGGLFSPKQQMTMPSSPTSPKPVPITLDPVERQLVYEGVSDWYFEPPSSNIKKSPLSPTSTTSATVNGNSGGLLLGLELSIGEVQCSVSKEVEKKSGGNNGSRKEFVRFEVRQIQLSYNQHMRTRGTGTPPEMNALFQIHEMELVDATQPLESPLGVIFGHRKKAKTNSLFQLKYHRLPDAESLSITLDSCDVLYNKRAFDKIYKYITPDQPTSGSTTSPTSPKQAPSTTVTAQNSLQDLKDQVSCPLQLNLLVNDATCSIAGEDATAPFLILHMAHLSVRSSNIYQEVDATAESLDALLVESDRLAGLWDDVSLQSNCRLAKKFKLAWTLKHHVEVDDEIQVDAWINNIVLSVLSLNVSETQCQQLQSLAIYLTTQRVKKSHQALPRPKRKIPVEMTLRVPAVSLRIVGNESLRAGLFLECTKWVSRVKLMSDLTSLHLTTDSFLAKEAQATTVHRAYSFGSKLMEINSPLTLFFVAGTDAPTLRVDTSSIQVYWHYDLIKEALKLFLAPVPLPEIPEAESNLCLHIRMHIGSWMFVMHPIEKDSMNIEFQGGEVDSTVEVYSNGDTIVDGTIASAQCTMARWKLANLPELTAFRYEASGVYALKERDGAAAYVEAKVTRGELNYANPYWICLGSYISMYVSQLFTWLYLTREGKNNSTMDPSKLRIKIKASVETLQVLIPSSLDQNTEKIPIQIETSNVMISSIRYLESPYEQLMVDATIIAAPWWTTATTVQFQYVLQIAELLQQVTVRIPLLQIVFDLAAYKSWLDVINNNLNAALFQVDMIAPEAAIETTVAIGVDETNLQLAAASCFIQSLHTTLHQTTSHLTMDLTWQKIKLHDTGNEKLDLTLVGRQRLEFEQDSAGQQTLSLTIDSMHFTPHIPFIQEFVDFVKCLPLLPTTVPSKQSPPLDISVAIRNIQVQIFQQQSQRLILHGGARIVVEKSAVRVGCTSLVAVVASTWPLQPFEAKDPLHFSIPNVGRLLCSPFQVDVDVADRALQVTLSSLDFAVSVADIWLIQDMALYYMRMNISAADPTLTRDIFVSVVVQDIIMTLVAPQGDVQLAPQIRVYGHQALLKYIYKFVSSTSYSNDWSLQLTDESCNTVDEGMSVWCFHASLGVWEPLIEPWAFLVSMVQTLEDDTTIHRLSFHGTKGQECRVNLSTSILERLCAILLPLTTPRKVEDSKVVQENASCGVYIFNDTEFEVSYHLAHSDCRDKQVIPPHTGTPLNLHTQPLMVSDETISLSWESKWQPLNEVRLHAFGQFVHLVPSTEHKKEVMPLLLDVEARRGLRTLTISSITKVYNDCSIPIRVGCTRDDGQTIQDAGVILPSESMGLSMEMCDSLHGLRLVLCPADEESKYQWSEPFDVESNEGSLAAACSLKVLEAKNCMCMPSFSTTTPQMTSTSQLCSHGKMYFKVVPLVRIAGHAFATIRVMAPILVDNQCPLPLSLLLFTTKKQTTKLTITKAPGLDEEIEPIQMHLVTSMTIAPHSRVHLYSASLLYKTYATIAIADQQWSQLLSLDTSVKEKEAIVTLKDSFKRQHAVNWSALTTGGLQIQCTVWPTYVLEDETKLNLQFDVELTSKKSLSSLLHLSNSKNSQNHSATDTLETDVIEATLEVLSEMATQEEKESQDIPYLLSGTSSVSIRLDPVRGMRTSTANVHLESVSDSVQNCHRLFSESSREWHDLGVRVILTTSRTKIVTFLPRYMVLNVTPYPFLLCPSTLVNKSAAPSLLSPTSAMPSLASTHRQSSSGKLTVPIGVATFAPNTPFAPFHWSSMADPTDYSVRTKPAEASSGWKWSGKFNLHEVGETALNVINKTTNQVHIIRIHIRVVHSTQILMVISLEEASHPLYRLVNATSKPLLFCQKFEMDPGFVREASAGESVWFGWDEPYVVDERSLLVLFSNKMEATVIVDQINDEIHTLDATNSGKIYFQMYLDGFTKVLHVSEHRVSRDTLMRVASSKIQHNIRYVVDVFMPSLVLSFVHDTAEIVVVTIQDSSIIGGYTPEGNEVEVKVQSVQIDNQHDDTSPIPVLFAPTKDDVEKTKEEIDDVPGPFFHLSVIRLFYHPDIEFIKYLSVLLQPATLQLDASILFSIADMVSQWQKLFLVYFPDLFIEKSVTRLAEKLQCEPRVYFETLQLHPLKLCVSFTQSTLPSQAEQVMSVVPGMFRILQTHLANIDHAPLHLNALHIFHSYTSISLLVSCVRQHYTTQALRQIYSLIGSAEILGNPLGLVSNLGCGVKDFFYEPAAGMVRGPGQFVRGLSRGTESLVKNSVYGTFNAASKLTGSISTGLANLSMDKTYIQSRSNRTKKDGPTNVGAGLLLGTKQLGQGILAGVSGIITQPAMGAYHNGLTGFVEGVGKGIIGAAVKPTAGILDLAAQTTAGITYSAASFDKKSNLKRLRLPRMMSTPDKRLTIYAPEKAAIARWLSKLPPTVLSSLEQYDRHVMLPNARVMIATSHQLMVLDTSSKPRVLWAYPSKSIQSSHSCDDGVMLLIQSDDKTIQVKIVLESTQDSVRDAVEVLVCHVVSRRTFVANVR